MLRLGPKAPLTVALVLLAALASTSSCDEVRRLDNFDVRITEEVVVDGRSVLGDLFEQFPQLAEATSFDITQSGTFQTEGYDPDDVDSVVLERVTFRVLEPEGQDLSFFGAVVFFLEAEGLPRIEVARQEEFPPGETSVDFQTTNADLKAYLVNQRGTVTAEITDSQLPAQQTRVEVVIVFDVDIDVI